MAAFRTSGPNFLVRLAFPFALVAVLFSTLPAQTSPLSDLEAKRRQAVTELEQAKADVRGARRARKQAEQMLEYAMVEFQRTAAALYMLLKPPSETDAETLIELRQAIQAQEWNVQVAMRAWDDARGRIAELDSRLAITRAQELRGPRTKQTTTHTRAVIACPVAQASTIYNNFGAHRNSGPHTGVDIPAASGTSARAAWYSVVDKIVTGGWMGKGVILRDAANNLWTYAHLARIDVRVGQVLARGQHLGLVGSTGNSTGPHLHFGIRASGTRLADPYSLVAPACGVFDALSRYDRWTAEAN